MACFVHSRGFLSGNLCANIPELTTSWCLIPLTLRTNDFLDHGDFPLRVARNWSRSSLRTPAVYYTINRRLFTTICLYLHPTACCCLILRLPVLRTIVKWVSWVIFLVAASAASRWTSWCLHCCCMPMSDVFDVSPANRLISIRLLLAGVVVFPWYVGVELERRMIMKKSGKSWGLYS